MADKTETDAMVELAVKAAGSGLADPTNIYTAAVPPNWRVETVDLERFLETPRRTRGTYGLSDVESLIDYATPFAAAKPDSCSIWVDPTAGVITAVINDADPSASGWRDHRATLALSKTPEWLHWERADGRLLTQADFAEHIQAGAAEIRQPPSADMLEIAQSIQGTLEANWKTAKRVDNGATALTYSEDVTATAGRDGKLEIPSEMTLGISPYRGEDPFELTARIRYRLRDGSLTIGYQLVRPHEVIDEVLKGIVDRLKADGSAFQRVYLGSAPPDA